MRASLRQNLVDTLVALTVIEREQRQRPCGWTLAAEIYLDSIGWRGGVAALWEDTAEAFGATWMCGSVAASDVARLVDRGP